VKGEEKNKKAKATKKVSGYVYFWWYIFQHDNISHHEKLAAALELVAREVLHASGFKLQNHFCEKF